MTYMTYILAPGPSIRTISTEKNKMLQMDYENLLARFDHNVTHLLDMVTLDLEDYRAFGDDKLLEYFKSQHHHYSIGGKCFPGQANLKDDDILDLTIEVENNRTRHLLKDIASWNSYHYSNIFFQILDSKNNFHGSVYDDLIALKPKMQTGIRIVKQTRVWTNKNRVFEEIECNISTNHHNFECKR